MSKIAVFSFVNMPIFDEEIWFMYLVHLSPLLQNNVLVPYTFDSIHKKSALLGRKFNATFFSSLPRREQFSLTILH